MGMDGAFGWRVARGDSVSFDKLALVATAIALYWAVIVNVAYCPLLLPPLPGGDASQNWLVWASCTLVHGIVAALALHGAACGRRVCGRAFLIAAAALADGGMAVLFYAPQAEAITGALGAVMLGAGAALVFSVWVQRLVSLTDARLVWVLAGWSHLGGLLISALTAALPCGLGRVATLALMPVAVLCLVRAGAANVAGDDGRKNGESAEKPSLPALPGIPVEPVRLQNRSHALRAPAPLGMLLCCVLLCIPMGVFRSLGGATAADSGADWRAILAEASLIVGAVMLVDLLSPHLRSSRFYYRLIVPLLAGGVFVSALIADDVQVSGALIVAATALFLVYAYYALGCLYDGCDRASLAGVTMVVVAIDFGMVGGALLGTALGASALSSVLEIVMGALYLALLVGMWAVPRTFEWLSGFDIIARSERDPA